MYVIDREPLLSVEVLFALKNSCMVISNFHNKKIRKTDYYIILLFEK